MSKKKFKLIDKCFSWAGKGEHAVNTGSSVTPNRVPDYVEWVHEGYGNHQSTFNNLTETDETFYTEDLIFLGLNDNKSAKKYGYLFEPKWYNQTAVYIKNNPEQFVEKYDAIFTHDKELIDLNPEVFKFAYGQGAMIEEVGMFEKTKLVSSILSTKSMSNGHKLRIDIGKQLEETGQVDCFGKLHDRFLERKIDGMKDYMFSFALENDVYPHYFTEKLLDCFMTGTIPIYLGDPEIGKFYNTDGMILIDYKDGGIEFNSDCLTEEFYNDRIDAVKDNYERVVNQQSVEDYIYLNYFND